MTALNTHVVRQHLTELEEVLRYLQGKSHVEAMDLLQSYELRLAVERALHLAIQNVIDIGNHLLAALGVNDVETYADIPRRLAQAQVIEEPLATRLVQMARFRNLLVHEYVKVEAKRLADILHDHLADITQFVTVVGQWMKKQGAG